MQAKAQAQSDFSFFWHRVSAFSEPLVRFRDLEQYESDLWEPLIEKGILRETPIPERFVDEQNRWVIVRQVNGRLWGVEDSDEPNGFEALSEDDVRQYCFSPAAFVDELRKQNGLVGRGMAESNGFVRLGKKRISSSDTFQVYLSLGSTRLGPIEDRLRLLARESSQAKRIVVFLAYPDIDPATEDYLEASNLYLTDISELDFQISWPAYLGVAPKKSQYALLNEGSTWRLIFEGKEITVPDSKGIRYLAKLLANPGKIFTALELAHPEAAKERFAQSDLETTDTYSLREYRLRLQRIEENLEEARAYDHENEIYQLEEEKDAILKHVSGVSATGGRSRLAGEKERARQAVSKALARATSSVPMMSSHVHSCICRGQNLVYLKERAFDWVIEC